MSETWMSVEGYEYVVSDRGRVRRIGGAILRQDLSRARSRGAKPYPAVRLSRCGVTAVFSVHRLVAFAFLGAPPFPRAEVNHLDGDTTNASASNLEWTTRSGNARHAYATGLQHPKGTKGEAHAKAKLTDDLVRQLRTRKEKGESGCSMAKALGMDPKTINLAISGRTWGHVGMARGPVTPAPPAKAVQ